MPAKTRSAQEGREGAVVPGELMGAEPAVGVELGVGVGMALVVVDGRGALATGVPHAAQRRSAPSADAPTQARTRFDMRLSDERQGLPGVTVAAYCGRAVAPEDGRSTFCKRTCPRATSLPSSARVMLTCQSCWVEP